MLDLDIMGTKPWVPAKKTRSLVDLAGDKLGQVAVAEAEDELLPDTMAPTHKRPDGRHKS